MYTQRASTRGQTLRSRIWIMSIAVLLQNLLAVVNCHTSEAPLTTTVSDSYSDSVTGDDTRTLEETTVLCLPRKFTFTVSNNLEVEGELLLCNRTVTVTSCYGRCESHEIPDYEVPYKISHHPVCTYGEREYQRVYLTNCDTRHPDPFVMIPTAESCSCMVCDSYDTNCETLT